MSFALSLPADDSVSVAPRKGQLRRVFNFLADASARAAIVGVVRVAAVSTLVGVGASAALTIGVTAIATGVGAGLYAYLKEYAQERKAARTQGLKVDFLSAQRVKKVKWALLAGVAGGAFGAWLAGTETFQSVLGTLKSGLMKAADFVTDGMSAHAATVAPVATAAVGVDQVWQTAMTNNTPQGNKVLTALFQANGMNPSGQALKDEAHRILRDKSLSMAERFSTARVLAEEAKKLGNHQAVAFLKDLARLEDKFADTAAKTLSLKTLSLPPVATVISAPLEHVATVDMVQPELAAIEMPKLVDIPPPAEQAAECQVWVQGDNAFTYACTKTAETMQPGRHFVSFVDAEKADIRADMTLMEVSDTVPTDAALSKSVILAGVDEIRALRDAVKAKLYPMP